MENRILCKAFDALPSMVFVVDRDVRVLEYNEQAVPFMGASPQKVLRERLGNVLACLHAVESEGGCGTGDFCETCVIRNSVTASFGGKKTYRARRKLQLKDGDETRTLYTLITASMFDKERAILTVENIDELSELGDLITRCSVCGDVLNLDRSWDALESFLYERWGMEFSHGLCPDCFKKELTKYGGLD